MRGSVPQRASRLPAATVARRAAGVALVRTLVRTLVRALVLTMVLALGACARGGGDGAGGGSGETLRIGGVGPLSQPGTVQAGLDMQWAMQAAVADVNADGGVLGREVELVFADTEGRPEAAGAVAKKLVEEDQVAGVVGEYHSSAALAQVPVYTEHGTPFIVVDAYADSITGGDPDDPGLPPQPPSVFRIAPSNSYDLRLHTDWLVDGLEVGKVVQVYEATDYGIGQAAAMARFLGDRGVELHQVQVELNQPDYTAILGRVAQRHDDADAVVVSATGETSYNVAANAFRVGLLGDETVCVANQAAQDDEAFWRAVPDGAGCVFRVAGPMPGRYSDAQRALAARYTEAFDSAPKAWVFESYDAVRLLVDAIARAGSAEPDEVVQALERTSYEGLLGTYEFPYGASTQPVPELAPSWLWHQWPQPAIQLAEYTKANQRLEDATVVWPPERQAESGTAFIPPG